jgi:hypothetical protein
MEEIFAMAAPESVEELPAGSDAPQRNRIRT